MDWKQYENEIGELLKNQYPEAEITIDARRNGIFSKTERQIDVLIERNIAGNKIDIVVDGKFWNKKVDVKAVEDFTGMLEDIGAHKGLLISQKGFSEAAYNRAHFGPSDIELDILNFEQLKQFQSFCAIPYAGENAVLLPAPFGWVIDGQRNSFSIATIYLQGRTLEDAAKNNEFMYIQFWDRKRDGHDLDDLISLQEQNFAEKDPDYSVEYQQTVKRTDARTILRIAKLKNYPTAEYTGFVEFVDFIFFCVMFSPENREKTNVKKLENMLKAALPIKIQSK